MRTCLVSILSKRLHIAPYAEHTLLAEQIGHLKWGLEVQEPLDSLLKPR
jgi:hypothetical protein